MVTRTRLIVYKTSSTFGKMVGAVRSQATGKSRTTVHSFALSSWTSRSFAPRTKQGGNSVWHARLYGVRLYAFPPQK